MEPGHGVSGKRDVEGWVPAVWLVRRMDRGGARAMTAPEYHGFVSYARDDRAMMEALMGRLEPDARNGFPKYWADTRLRGGHRWNKKIGEAIARAEIFLLLVTEKFLNSQYITNVELPAIEARAEDCGGLIVPIILRPCMWNHHLKEIQAVPSYRNGRPRPVSDWKPQGNGYHAAHSQLLDALKEHWPDRFGDVS